MARQRELAREVRAGLTVINGNKNSGKEADKLDKLYYRKPIRQHVKEFGALFAAIFLVIAAVQIYKSKPPMWPSVMIGAAGVFAFLGYKAPAILHPVWSGWMKFAQVLGGIMTLLLLGIAWTLVLLPISLILRLIQKKIMNMSFRQDVSTYWETREDNKHDFKLLNRQF